MPIISIEIMKTDERERCNTRFTNKVSVQAVPHPDVFWYRLDGRGTQKNMPKKQKSFQETIYPSPNALNIKYFWVQLQLLGFFGYH